MEQATRLGGAAFFLCFVACGAVLCLFAIFPQPYIDDAFITFRYALNLSAGNGFSYNPSEGALLGTTAPLWALLLAGADSVGIPAPSAALTASIIAALALFSFAYCEIIRERFGTGRGLAIFLFLLLPILYSAIFSGLETWCYSLLVVLSLHLLLKKRIAIAAALGCIAALLRPDGAILVLLSLGMACTISARVFFSTFLISTVMLAPWIVYSIAAFGTVLPHSIAAKRIVHPGEPLANLLLLSEVVVTSPSLFISFLLGASGLALAIKVRKYLPVLIWVGAYAAGLVFSGVKPIFFWYLTPVWIVLLIFGSAALFDFLSARAERPLPRTTLSLGFTLIAAFIAVLSVSRLGTVDEAQQRDVYYRELGPLLAERSSPGESFYLCETGILGYYLQDHLIFDSSGINSKGVYEIRRAAKQFLEEKGLPPQPDRFTDWSAQVITRFKPDWIVSPRAWCQMGVIEEQGWFKEVYEREMLHAEELLGGIGVYRRRENSP